MSTTIKESIQSTHDHFFNTEELMRTIYILNFYEMEEVDA